MQSDNVLFPYIFQSFLSHVMRYFQKCRLKLWWQEKVADGANGLISLLP